MMQGDVVSRSWAERKAEEKAPRSGRGSAAFNKEVLPFQTVETFKNKRCAVLPALFSIHEASRLVVRQDENNTQ